MENNLKRIKILQTQVSNGEQDVMTFMGTLEKIVNNSIFTYQINLNNNVPYLLLQEVDSNQVHLKFCESGTQLLLKQNEISDYVFKDAQLEIKLEVTLIEKVIENNYIKLVYNIFKDKQLLTKNKLEIEVI